MRVSDADVRRYVDDGFLVVDGVVQPAELDELKEDAVRFARGEYPLVNPVALPDGASDEEAMASVLAVHFPHWVSEVMRRYVTHPGVSAALSRITAAHLPHWDGSVKCMQSMLFVKPPSLPGQAWHQDERFIPTRDRSLVGAWMALDDATVENGCLRVLPGSHRNGYLWPTRAHERPGEFDTADEAFGFDESGEIAVEVKAGALVFFNGYLLHRSFRNGSDVHRRALVNHYCNAWSLLPWKPTATNLKGAEIAVLDNRNIVPVGDDPYAWKGYSTPPTAVFLRPHEPDQRWA